MSGGPRLDAERNDLSEKPEVTAAVVCLLPDRGRLGAERAAPLFAMLARLAGAVRATVLVGGEPSSEPDDLIGSIRVARGAGPIAAALGRGVDAALALSPADVLVLLTPELSSWRPEESALADRSALALVARMHGVAGWHAHLDGEAPLREGLLLVAAALWRRRGRALAEAESWGDLAARAGDAGAPVFDLRALRRLVELGLGAPTATEGLASGLTRSLARLGGWGSAFEARFKLDEKQIPRSVRHGDPIPVALSGWVAPLPQAEELELRIGGRRQSISIDVARPDVLLAAPDLADDRCGFRFVADLPPLPVGIHDVSLVVVPERAERALGAVRVRARLEILLDRTLAPPAYRAGEGLPLLTDGRVVVSHPPVRLEAWLDDQRLDVSLAPIDRPAVAERPTEVGFRIAQTVRLQSDRRSHRLRLRAHDRRGRSVVEESLLVAEPGGALQPQLEIDLGPRDARTGRCALRVRGVSFGVPPGARIVVEIDGHPLGEAPSAIAAAAPIPFATFELLSEPRLAPGAHELVVRLGPEDDLAVIDRRELFVAEAEPELVVERAGLEGATRGTGSTLRIQGELRYANLIDSIRVLLDGRLLEDVDPRSFQTAPGAPGEERRRFGITREVAFESGRHELGLELRRAGEPISRWSGELHSPTPAGGELALVSSDLDRLRRGSPAPVWSSLAIEGELQGAPRGAELALRVDGTERTRGGAGPSGRFRLVQRIDPGLHTAALEVVSGAETLARSPAFEVLVRRLEIPAAWSRDLDVVRAALGPAASRLDGFASEELLRCHLESRLSETGELGTALTALAERVRESAERPGRIVRELPAPPRDPMRILFFSWEIPWSGHGGGVAMVNLLRHLGARHEIVLLHPVHAGAESLSEEVRSSVAEIITVPRAWSRPIRPEPFGVPAALLPTFTEELAGALAAELASGAYALVNIESAGSYLHLARTATPSLLVDLDTSSFALAVEDSATPFTERSAASWMRELLGALTFDTLKLPERVDRIAVVTEPEARFLLPFSPGRELFVNPLAIDLERFAPRASSSSSESATFVLVGNYRHPPNRRAARRVIESIAPRLRSRLPGMRFLLVGPEMPPELAEAARGAGIDCPGFVPDLALLYAGATATLAPIDSGGGMRVKLLEAMASSCPVVTTALGMNGLDARAGEEFLLAESDDEFVAAAVRLANDASLRQALAARARAMLEREHSIPVQGERRERIWAATIAAAGRSQG